MTAVDTVGVDLAADHRGTAICRITWDGRGAVVHRPERPGRDERILELARDAAKVGIDCPFGWPAAFVGAMSAHAARHPWPDRGRLSGRDHLKFRETDRHVRAACAADAARGLGALHPFAVSADSIGVVALRCAGLLDRMGDEVDRTGLTGPACEVYPAAALHRWSVLRRGYKSTRDAPARVRALELRSTMLAEIVAGVDGLHLDPDVATSVVERHDEFDAFVGALVARGAVLGHVDPPPQGDDAAAVPAEGWIALPGRDTLAILPRAGGG